MKSISERYLLGEWTDARNWANYISGKRMSLQEALDYIRSASSEENREAHFADSAAGEKRQRGREAVK